MPQPTTRACPDGINKAIQALKGNGLSQSGLAKKLTKDPNIEISISDSTVNAFFNGRPVRDDCFYAICKYLELDRNEIAGTSHASKQVTEQSAPLSKSLTETINIDELVRTARKNIDAYIEERCGTMRVLDMTQPIGLDDIYTSVNILEKITGRRRFSLEELYQTFSASDFDRFSLGRVSETVPGLDAVEKYSKLMILGKPGAGKTTFLKHLARLCIKGKFQPKRIPLFITLKEFAEYDNQLSMLDFLIHLFARYGIAPNTKVKEGFLATIRSKFFKNEAPLDVDLTAVEQLLTQGKLLLLLDGLDEVQAADSSRVLQEIQDFTTKFNRNQFVITCRIAAREYTFGQFTEVEVADFNDEQIKSFSQKWFTAKKDTVKANKFFEKLQDEEPIRELATNPLLLTLLCLVFEETAEFPKNRSELYKEGLDVLLKKWDVKRNIEREQVYKKLSLKRKEDLLSQVAYSTFEQEQYFFKQKEVEARIIEYIRNLPDCSDDPEVLQLDSEAVLKSIEAQHGLFVERARGIYSFSHLTFHEYFTARKIVTNTGDNKLLLILADRITKTRWREVFLLTVGMLDNADTLLQLMKKQIDSLLTGEEKLQQYLAWVEEKSNSVRAPYKKAAVRVIYFGLVQDIVQDFDLDKAIDDQVSYRYFCLDRALTGYLVRDLAPDQNLVLYQDLYINLCRSLGEDLVLYRDLYFDLCRSPDEDLVRVLDQDLVRVLDFMLQDEFKRKLWRLMTELPNIKDVDALKQWWNENGANWTEQLRAIMIKYRNIGHDWQFTESQKELLNKYHSANKLLLECLTSDCYVSRDVRNYIADTLLLPIKSIPPYLEN
ncbi:hypothetical protein NIES2101_38145 [Calothrix sp. HK-06]|nr:hypothetical protein NIES2101_38145 [Calothrix sp. HK-06]